MRPLVARLLFRALVSAAALVVFGAVGRRPGSGIRRLVGSRRGRHAAYWPGWRRPLTARCARPYLRRARARHRGGASLTHEIEADAPGLSNAKRPVMRPKATHPDQTADWHRPPRTAQLTWTRLGRAMGVTESAAARDEIRVAAEQMPWVEPHQLQVLTEVPAQAVVAAIFSGRRDDLGRAGVAVLAGKEAGRRLIGLEDADGRRYVLVHDDYRAEVIYVLRTTPVNQVAA